ncbi:MAG TPA: alpha-L-fucosidase [Rhodanobacter sp.]|jgi:alpha-L-fucosidase|nr:alpha-L-fucosidase [Rhodanobacter sp.]
MKKVRLFALLLGLACMTSAAAISAPAAPAGPVAQAQRMQWFKDAKLGIFIHWGIYSVNGIDESWSFFNGKISYPDYMKQLHGFTAAHYDPQAWADLIRQSGARYTVLTSRHHDGVALWDSAQGINVVKDTPAARDLLGPFVNALRKDDIKVGLYYSLADWSSPDYDVFTRKEKRYTNDPVRWKRFVAYYQGQLRELSQRYNPDLFWFDGDWEHTAQQWQAANVRTMLLARNPNAILNSRLTGNGDYATPEQGVPLARPNAKYWELCLTTNDSWGYQPQDHNFKTPTQVIGLLADTASMGGNLLLDIGPRADGSMQPEQVAILQALGKWLGKHGAAIYGTDAGLPKDYYYGPSTLSADHRTLYLFLSGKPNGPVMLKGLKNTVLHASMLGSGETLKIQVIGNSVDAPSLLYIDASAATFDPQMSVIALQLDGPAAVHAIKTDAKR